jgi:hypothetical protein
MPVSTPSYFPPNRASDQIIGINAGLHYVGARCFLAGQEAGNNSTVTDIVIIGDDSFSQGITDQLCEGTVSIGSQSLSSLLASGGSGANTAVGFNAGKAMTYGGENVFIGDNAAALTPGASGAAVIQNVIIGSGAAAALAGSVSENPRIQQATIIGYNAAASGSGDGSFCSVSVIIGANCAANIAGNIQGSVLIGANCVEGMNSGSGVIIIGCGTNGGVAPSNGTYIGTGITIGSSTQTTAIGYSLTANGGHNVVLGDFANDQGGSFSVIIGSNAGANEPATGNVLIIETGDHGTETTNNRLIYGIFGSTLTADTPFGIIFGNSSAALVNEDIQGCNSVKIINGVKGLANPIGGGYFYVSAGALHWVGSSGTDTTLGAA